MPNNPPEGLGYIPPNRIPGSGCCQDQPIVATETSEPVSAVMGFARITTNPHAAGLLKAVKSGCQAKIDKSEVELKIYLGNPVGVGEHSAIVSVIHEKISYISSCKGMIAEVERLEAELEADD